MDEHPRVEGNSGGSRRPMVAGEGRRGESSPESCRNLIPATIRDEAWTKMKRGPRGISPLSCATAKSAGRWRATAMRRRGRSAAVWACSGWPNSARSLPSGAVRACGPRHGVLLLRKGFPAMVVVELGDGFRDSGGRAVREGRKSGRKRGEVRGPIGRPGAPFIGSEVT